MKFVDGRISGEMFIAWTGRNWLSSLGISDDDRLPAI